MNGNFEADFKAILRAVAELMGTGIPGYIEDDPVIGSLGDWDGTGQDASDKWNSVCSRYNFIATGQLTTSTTFLEAYTG